MELSYFSSEAAKVLGIGVSTLRNYAAVLESKGYGFARGSNNGRLFREVDLELIKKMAERISEKGLKIGEAADLAIDEAKENGEEFVRVEVPAGPSAALSSSTAALIEKLCEQIHHLEKQQKTFAEIHMQLAKEVERLTEKMEDRERDLQLFEKAEESRNKKKRKGSAFFRPLLKS